MVIPLIREFGWCRPVANNDGRTHSCKVHDDFDKIGLKRSHWRWCALYCRKILFLALVLAANGVLTDMNVIVDLMLGLCILYDRSLNAVYRSFLFIKCSSVSFGSIRLRTIYSSVNVAKNKTIGAAFWTPVENNDVSVVKWFSIILFKSTSICLTICRIFIFLCLQNLKSICACAAGCQQ